jgi:peptide/nickel transport system permease protein
MSELAERVRIRDALLARKTVVIGLLVLGCIAFAAICAPLLSPISPTKLAIAHRLRLPYAGSGFGTDDFGRDVFTRVL